MTSVVAIMQPYVFPYIGYFNLVQAADEFVFYDDVNFIRQGWLHRNRIAIADSAYRFTVPISNASQNRSIADTRPHNIEAFASKFLRQLAQSYSGAPYFERAIRYVEGTLYSNSGNIGELAAHSIVHFFRLMDIDKNFHFSSKSFQHTRQLGRSERLMAITRELKSSEYVNVLGGKRLYSKAEFAKSSINMRFIRPTLRPYSQHNATEFIAELSIIDLLMNLSLDEIRRHLRSYSFS